MVVYKSSMKVKKTKVVKLTITIPRIIFNEYRRQEDIKYNVKG